MKKILSIAIISTLALVLSTGCSSTTPTAGHDMDSKISEEALYMEANNEKIIEVIKIAADGSGWDITEFKSNEIIAEKTDNGETISSIIKIYNGYIEFENEDASELHDAVDDAIRAEDKDLH